jgi:trimethylguanosine synthase
MGKRNTGLTGISRFLNAFEDTPDDCATQDKRIPSKPVEESPADEPPRKKRKTIAKQSLLGPGNEKYDATDLVPYYMHAREVPTHLQKCKESIFRGDAIYDVKLSRLRPTHSSLLSLFFRMPFR